MDSNDLNLSVQKLMLWMNSGCNARCGMCDIWREASGRTLTFSQIAMWIPEWKAQGLKTVVLCGESLMHPEIWPIVSAIKSAGIQVEILSNGLLLRKHARQVVTHCDVLRVSLDGPAEVHNQMRGLSKAYEKLADGMAALRELAPDFPVGGRCAVHLKNFRHLEATVCAAKSLGLSSLSFSATDVYNEEAFRRVGRITDSYVDGLVIGGGNIEALRVELERLFTECATDFESGFISDTPNFLREQVLGYYVSLVDREQRRTIRCNSPWTSAVLDYDGTVRPCFPMPGYGNIIDLGGLGAAINSEAAKRLREGLEVSKNEVCRRCVDQTINLAKSQ